jgi:hypothetical protein
MSHQNLYQYKFKKWSVKPSSQFFDISIASDERNFNEEVVFSNQIIGVGDGNILPIHFDLNNSGSSQMMTINYGEYFTGNTLVSLNYYNPNNENLSCFTSTTLCDIGLTGIDNGLVSNFSGESINFTMGLYTGSTKWDRRYYDRRLKLIPISANTNTPITLTLESEYSPGSIVAQYTLTSDIILNDEVTVSFTNSLGLIGGGYLEVVTGVTINSGNFSGVTIVNIDNSFDTLSRVSEFSAVTSSQEGSIYSFEVTPNIIFPTPTPTITSTPTNTLTNTPTGSITPTITETPTNTPTESITPTTTETPTNTPTNTTTPTITETPTNTPTGSVTPTSTQTPTSTITPTVTETPTNTPTGSVIPTVTQTPTNTPTSTITPSVTQTPTSTITPTVTNTPSSSPSSGGIVTNNLFMKLDATNYISGTWSDETGNGNNATVNGATWISDNGGIFDFDGINDTISIPHNSNLSLNTTTQRTIQVWVKFDTLPSLNTEGQPVFGKLSSNFGFDGYYGTLFSNTSNTRVITNGTGSARTTTSTSNPISVNTWYLYTFISQITAIANTTKVYINTTEVSSTAHGSDGYSESNPLYLGFIGSGVGSAYLNGKIGACYFYTAGLTTEQISTNYNNTKSKYETPSVTQTPTSTPTGSMTPTPTITETPTNTPTSSEVPPITDNFTWSFDDQAESGNNTYRILLNGNVVVNEFRTSNGSFLVIGGDLVRIILTYDDGRNGATSDLTQDLVNIYSGSSPSSPDVLDSGAIDIKGGSVYVATAIINP